MAIVRKMRKTQGLGLFEQRDEWGGAVKRYLLKPTGLVPILAVVLTHTGILQQVIWSISASVFSFFNLNIGDNKRKS